MISYAEIHTALTEHYQTGRGMSYGAPDTCACGVQTNPERGESDVSIRRAEAFAAHQANVIWRLDPNL